MRHEKKVKVGKVSFAISISNRSADSVEAEINKQTGSASGTKIDKI